MVSKLGLIARRISVSGLAEPSSACQKAISSATAATHVIPRMLRYEAARTAISIVAPRLDRVRLSAARRMTIFARIGALSMMPATYLSTTCACSCVRARHNTTPLSPETSWTE